MLGLKPIKTLPIREKIAANLREAILSKKIPAGEKPFIFWQEMDFWNWSEINVQ